VCTVVAALGGFIVPLCDFLSACAPALMVLPRVSQRRTPALKQILLILENFGPFVTWTDKNALMFFNTLEEEEEGGS